MRTEKTGVSKRMSRSFYVVAAQKKLSQKEQVTMFTADEIHKIVKSKFQSSQKQYNFYYSLKNKQLLTVIDFQ